MEIAQTVLRCSLFLILAGCTRVEEKPAEPLTFTFDKRTKIARPSPATLLELVEGKETRVELMAQPPCVRCGRDMGNTGRVNILGPSPDGVYEHAPVLFAGCWVCFEARWRAGEEAIEREGAR